MCFGTRNDNYGSFKNKEPGFISTFKLIHKSGSLRCAPKYPASYWGCMNPSHGEEKLTTVITFTNRTALLLANYSKRLNGNGRSKLCRYYSYHLDGVNGNSTELVFNKLPSALPVPLGQEFQIWYGQDLVNCSENNNSGKTCVDVYALYA